MEQIASFCIDHEKLKPGLYLSRRDGDVDTYDLRFYKPNGGVYLSNGVLHSFEHLFATILRNGPQKKSIVYFGPMGCRTGFYLLVRNLKPEPFILEVRRALLEMRDYQGELPGATAQECGNYMEHDLPGAKKEAARYLSIIAEWRNENLNYPK